MKVLCSLRFIAAGLALLAFAAAGFGERLPGQIVVDGESPAWLARYGEGPFFMSGPGDPEGFLFRGELRADGTRDGDQAELIEKLAGTGANCIYLMAVRSHGGDGDATENPFVENDPARGVNMKVLDQWEEWFSAMDEAGIVAFFFLYDDSASVWDTGDEVGGAEREFIRVLVDRFEHHRSLIWCVAEEYSEVLSAARVRKIAAAIRADDDHDHPIAVHKLTGLDFSEFADDPNIDQFAIQYREEPPAELHRAIVGAWKEAKGRYNLNFSEVPNTKITSRADARRRYWAVAMAGAYVMVLRMDIAGTPIAELEDMGRIARFFESTDFNTMSPHDELALAGSQYVLAEKGQSYIAYSCDAGREMGIKDMSPGRYDLSWLNCATGAVATQEDVEVHAGDATWQVPESLAAKTAGTTGEIAVYIRRGAE